MKWQAASLFAFGLSHLYGANLILNPGFESPAIPGAFTQYGSGSNAISDWTVTGATCGANCVLLLNTGYAEGPLTFQAEGGVQSVDLTWAGNTGDGGIQQTVNLTQNQLYRLSFWVGNMDNAAVNYPGPSVIELFLNGVSRGTFTNNASTSNAVNWTQATFTFLALQATNVIEFRNATATPDNYAGLDDVFLDFAAAAEVPEPATFALISIALLSVASVRRVSR